MRSACVTTDRWLEAELEWLWIGAYWANAANTARYGGHDVGNLRVSVSSRHGTGLLTLRVTNLLDAAYADRADFAFGEYRYFPGRGSRILPRTRLAEGLTMQYGAMTATALVGRDACAAGRHERDDERARGLADGGGARQLRGRDACFCWSRAARARLAAGSRQVGRRALVGLGRGILGGSTSRRRPPSGR